MSAALIVTGLSCMLIWSGARRRARRPIEAGIVFITIAAMLGAISL